MEVVSTVSRIRLFHISLWNVSDTLSLGGKICESGLQGINRANDLLEGLKLNWFLFLGLLTIFAGLRHSYRHISRKILRILESWINTGRGTDAGFLELLDKVIHVIYTRILFLLKVFIGFETGEVIINHMTSTGIFQFTITHKYIRHSNINIIRYESIDLI